MKRAPPRMAMVPSPFSGTAAKAGAAASSRASVRRICDKIHAADRKSLFLHGARSFDRVLLRAAQRAAGAGGGRVSLPQRRRLGVRGRSGGDDAGIGAADGGAALAGGGSGGA